MSINDYAILFWGPNHQGYCYDINRAGKYSQEEVDKCFKRPECDMPVPCEVIDRLAQTSVIDNQAIGRICKNTPTNQRKLKIYRKELLKKDTVWDAGAFCTCEEFLNRYERIYELIVEIKNLKNN
jgi:hypothetical protein